MRFKTQRRVGVALLACGALTLGACAEDEDTGTTAGSPTTTATEPAKSGGPASADLLAAIRKPSDAAPPSTSRPAAKDKSVAYIVNAMNQPSTAKIANAGMQACRDIGWDCTLLDGKGDPTTYPGLVRTAVAQKPDGIIIEGIDCSAISQPLKEAKQAGIKLAGVDTYDCDDPKVGGTKQYDATVLYSDPLNTDKAISAADQARVFGRAKAAVTLDSIKGNPNVIHICDNEILVLQYICEGAQAGFADAGAKVTEIQTKFADLGPKLESQVSSALLKDPDANAIVSPHGGASLIIGPAVQKAGRQASIFVMGSEGLVEELDMIRAGLLGAVIAAPTPWKGWAAVDTMNQVFNGKPAVNSGLTFLRVDKSNVPSGKGADLPADTWSDYRSAYKKAWGVE